jgi:putative DNA primase/helicase
VEDVAPVEPATSSEVLSRTTSGRACTDLGNGERMADLYGDRFRYVANTQTWFYWNGRVWEQDALQHVMGAAKAMVRRIWEEADEADPGEAPTTHPGEGKTGPQLQALKGWLDSDPANAEWFAGHKVAERLKAWAVKSQGIGAITAAVRLFASERDVAARAEDFDGDRNLVNMANGVYNLQTMTFDPTPKPEHMLSKLFGCEYDPHATAPRWEQYLREVLPDPDVRGYAQRAMGYTLSGRVNEKAMFFLLGPKDTGKTIFIETMLAIFGEYGLTAAPSLLAKKREGGISNDVADLRGYRLAITSETGHNTMLDETLMKQLAGGDTIRNRGLYQNNTSWKPQCGVWLASNHHPRIAGDDDAIWGRIKVLNFTVQFSREPGAARRVDPYLPDALAKESAGILNWLLDGYAEWRSRGLAEPMQVTVDSAMYQREQDTVSQFLEEKLDEWAYIEHPDARFDQALMWLNYEAWCRANAVTGYGKKRFNEALAQRFGRSASGKRFWIGIGLRADYSHLLGRTE